jgi:putative transposase
VFNGNVVKLIRPGILTDRLTEVLRDGARALLTQAVEAEVSEFLAATADLKTDGCRRVVRHGHLPERQIMTGIGPVAVRQPRVRDREAGADDPARIRYTPAILPPYARRSKSLDTLIPILYLKGVSTGDFAPALAALLGKDAPGLSATTIARLKEVWTDEHKRWSERDLSAKSYVYVWADGVYLQARLEDEAQCILVIIGAHAGGQEGADRLCRRRARERSRLARPAARSQAQGSVDGAQGRRRRRRARLLEGDRRALAQDP